MAAEADAPPPWYRTPLTWYARQSARRPVVTLAAVSAVVLLLVVSVAGQFGLSDESNYDWSASATGAPRPRSARARAPQLTRGATDTRTQ